MNQRLINTDDNFEPIDCEIPLNEFIERINIYKDACNQIISKLEHKAISHEIKYQQQRIRYSKAYFEGHPFYVGNSLLDSDFFKLISFIRLCCT